MGRRVTMSATLAADESLERRRRAGQRVLAMTSGEIGLPVHPALAAVLAGAAKENTYGPVTGRAELRTAAAGYWTRRGLPTDPDLVVAGPGSKPLLFALLLAIGGDAVVIPNPSWVSYAAHAHLLGVEPIRVPIRPGEGGVPDPDLLRTAVRTARAAGRDPRSVVVTVPDNPTGTLPTPDTVARLARVARELDLVVISDEIYHDLVFAAPAPEVSPARYAPERTVTTTGLTKNLALGGWRIGVARLPEGGRELRDHLVGVASQVWSSAPAPVQVAAAYAFGEPAEIVRHVAACTRLHATVANAVADRLTAAGALLAPVRATCYLYPDFEPLRARLAETTGTRTAAGLATWLADHHGVAVLPGSAFGEPPAALRLRLTTSRLYGTTDEERMAALTATDPLALPWIRAAVDHLDEPLRVIAHPATRTA